MRKIVGDILTGNECLKLSKALGYPVEDVAVSNTDALYKESFGGHINSSIRKIKRGIEGRLEANKVDEEDVKFLEQMREKVYDSISKSSPINAKHPKDGKKFFNQ